MGTNLVIPTVMKGKRVATIFYPEDDLRHLIREYMGSEMADLYDEVLATKECEADDEIKDDSKEHLESVKLELYKLLRNKHIKKDDIARIYDRI